MGNKGIIYTYGNTHISPMELIGLLQPYHINCVLDCRINSGEKQEELKTILNKNGIYHMSFQMHFGFYPMDVRDNRGNIVYKKAISTPIFQEGVKRIETGLQRKFVICMIDAQNNLLSSERFTIVGKYLKENYEIRHIQSNCHYKTQEQVEYDIANYKGRIKEKRLEALQTGKSGEELAALYLSSQGYQVLDMNWNLHRGCELDIVALKNNILHFIEVKTRRSDKYGEPQTAINYRKMKNLLKAISEYRHRRFHTNMPYQIDSIAIIYRSEEDYELKHFLDIRTDGGACDSVRTYHKRPSE